MAKRRIGDDAAGFAELLSCWPTPATAPGADPGGDRDHRAGCWWPPARHRPRGLRDQPDGRGPLPRPAHGRPARNPTTPTRWSWPTSCAPTGRAHRPLPADTELAQAIAVLARAQQDAVWARTEAHNKLRSLLREYYPGFLAAFRRGRRDNLASPEARAAAGRSPRPRRAAAKLTPAQIAHAAAPGRPPTRHRRLAAELHQALRSRNCASPRWSRKPWAARPWPCCATSTPPAPTPTSSAAAATRLRSSTLTHESSPACPASANSPAPGYSAEIGDDRTRFADARALKAYAGSAPVTRASGKTTSVMHRRVKNHRLATVGYLWAFAALTASPPARAHYDRRRPAGDRHAAAQRNLFNRMLGQPDHCLHTGQTYDPIKAFGEPTNRAELAAA